MPDSSALRSSFALPAGVGLVLLAVVVLDSCVSSLGGKRRFLIAHKYTKMKDKENENDDEDNDHFKGKQK